MGLESEIPILTTTVEKMVKSLKLMQVTPIIMTTTMEVRRRQCAIPSAA